MNRTIFLIDGFNIYHSLNQAQLDHAGTSTKWLDLHGLCSSFLYLIGQRVSEKAEMEAIHYFSAAPVHRSSAKQSRHSEYIRCLKNSGILIHLGRFKEKEVRCPICHQNFTRHEEKETDVAIAIKLFEICHNNQADSIVLVTGDTDLAPAVRACNTLFPHKFICFAFPYRRSNAELKQLAPHSFNISCDSIFKHQFKNPLVLADGSSVPKPMRW